MELFLFRPEILKQEIKVFFVKYNDPIYVKLEKLDIMIRLASQANIAQVLTSRSWGLMLSCCCIRLALNIDDDLYAGCDELIVCHSGVGRAERICHRGGC